MKNLPNSQFNFGLLHIGEGDSKRKVSEQYKKNDSTRYIFTINAWP